MDLVFFNRLLLVGTLYLILIIGVQLFTINSVIHIIFSLIWTVFFFFFFLIRDILVFAIQNSILDVPSLA